MKDPEQQVQEDVRRYQPSLDAEVEERRRFAEEQLKVFAMSNEAEILEVKTKHRALRDFFLPTFYSPLLRILFLFAAQQIRWNSFRLVETRWVAIVLQ